jgi:hypothetical protein
MIFKNALIGSTVCFASLSLSLSAKHFITAEDAVSSSYLGHFCVPRKILFSNLFFELAGVCSSCCAVPLCLLSAYNNSSSAVSPFSSNSRFVAVSLSRKSGRTNDISLAYFHLETIIEE